ncbi:sugar ABC transporter permease [Neobacillus drentensis]|uniref:carbohydrate ABC transporter permease n=1 Tax=Neobacillus TaxID=2675232 RepID=UPI0030030617
MAKTRRSTSIPRHERRNFWIYISPWIIGFIGFTAIPFFSSLILSFMQWDIITPPKWVGLENYKLLLNDKIYFWTDFKNTLFYALVGVPLSVTLGLLISILLSKEIKGINIYRTIFYLPAVFGGVAVLMLWSYLLYPGTGDNNAGLINAALNWLGIPAPSWSQSSFWAKPAVILVGLWGVGGSMMIWLPALAGVPKELLEAAEMDGASRWRRFWSVTFPLITPAIFFQVTMGIIGSFQIFLEPKIMPGSQKAWTDSLMVNLFDNAFVFYKMGYASAIAWILFIVIMALTIINLLLSKRWVYYESK